MAIDAWYPVKLGGLAAAGTDDGRYTVKPTGSFADLGVAGYYDNILDALNAATPPNQNSLGLVSSLHDFTDAGTLNYSVIVSPYPPMFVSVNDANMAQSLIGALERTASTNDFVMNLSGSAIAFHGISFNVGDDFLITTPQVYVRIEAGSVNFNGSGDRFTINNDGAFLELIDTDITWPSGTTVQVFQLANNATVHMTGGKIDGGSGTVTDLVGGSSSLNAGLIAKFKGTNLEDVIGYLLSDTGGGIVTDDSIVFEVDGCILNAGLAGFVQEKFHGKNQSALITNSAPVGVVASSQYFNSLPLGDIQNINASGIVRVGGPLFSGASNIGRQITTTSDCSITNPLVFNMPARFAQLSLGSEDVLTVYFAVVNTVVLTNSNFFATVINPNGANGNLWDYSTTRNSDILSDGVPWTDDSSGAAWENNGVALTGYNIYKMDIPITGGGDGVPIIQMSLMVPDIAGDMYMSLETGVS